MMLLDLCKYQIFWTFLLYNGYNKENYRDS